MRGFGTDIIIPEHWVGLFYGDAEHFLQVLADFNEALMAKQPDTKEGLYISPPADFEETRRDQLYLQTVRELLSPGDNGKRLLIGQNKKLRSALHNVDPESGGCPRTGSPGVCLPQPVERKALDAIHGAPAV